MDFECYELHRLMIKSRRHDLSLGQRLLMWLRRPHRIFWL